MRGSSDEVLNGKRIAPFARSISQLQVIVWSSDYAGQTNCTELAFGENRSTKFSP